MENKNTGVDNSGHRNSGNRNSGHRNSGNRNSGNRNSGSWNSGNWNSGNWNSGNRNSGNWNSGNWNSGNWNSGNWNSGNWNRGNWNSGNWNSGDYNSGDHNNGNQNSGNWNSGNWNSGYFNTDAPDKIRIFGQWVDMTHEEFNDKYNIYADIPLNCWIYSEDMTAEEKHDNEGWEERGGYLKTLSFKQACCIWWAENPDRHQDFLSLPHFNAEMFKEITGIDVEKKTELSDDELIAELERRGKVKEGKIIVLK